MVMRPKSIATVVVVLVSTPSVSSTPTPRSDSTSSVRSGLISLIDPTRVVLPTPNPPAMRILSATGSSESTESIDHFLENALTRARSGRGGGRYRDEALVTQVAQQDADDSDWQVELDGHVGHRDRVAGRAHDERLLGGEVVPGFPHGAHGRDEVEIVPRRPRTTSDESVGPHDGPGVLVQPLRGIAHGMARGLVVMCWPTRFTSIAIS